MEIVSEYIENNFSTMFSMAAGWIALVILASVAYRSRKPKLRRVAKSDLKFSETGASGRSHKNLITRLGGARNCLVVELGRRALVVRPFFPFNLMFLPEIYDLEHFIPLERIDCIESSQSFGRQAVFIEFKMGRTQRRRIELRLQKHDEFMIILQQMRKRTEFMKILQQKIGI